MSPSSPRAAPVYVDRAATAAALDYPSLVSALADAFAEKILVPQRQMLDLEDQGALMAIMPAWQAGGCAAVKLATIVPDNPARGVPTVQAVIILFEAKTTTPLAFIDGTEATLRRTAAASALAARYLARADSARLTVVGTGALAPHMAAAHAAVRPIREVRIWGRTAEKAEAALRALRALNPDLEAVATADLAGAIGWADVVTCATSSPTPLIEGRYLKPGLHVDLVGAHHPQRREADSETVRRARVYVDTRSGALAEAGDLLIPLDEGTIDSDHVLGEMADLVAGRGGRRDADEITLFKSVGTGIEDLAAARLVVQRLGRASS